MAWVVEAKIVIPLKSHAIGEVSNIDNVLLDVEDVLVERLGVAVAITSGITRKPRPRKRVKRLESLGLRSVIPSQEKPHSD